MLFNFFVEDENALTSNLMGPLSVNKIVAPKQSFPKASSGSVAGNQRPPSNAFHSKCSVQSRRLGSCRLELQDSHRTIAALPFQKVILKLTGKNHTAVNFQLCKTHITD